METDIRAQIQALPATLDEQQIGPESFVPDFAGALRTHDLDAISIASWLHAVNTRCPGYLRTLGAERIEAITASRLLELLLVLYEKHSVHAEAPTRSWLNCIEDPLLDALRADLTVLDLALTFVAQLHQQRTGISCGAVVTGES